VARVSLKALIKPVPLGSTVLRVLRYIAPPPIIHTFWNSIFMLTSQLRLSREFEVIW
jgi:hypothetical protein